MFALQGLLSNTSASIICIDKDFSRLSLASSLGAHYVAIVLMIHLWTYFKITDGKCAILLLNVLVLLMLRLVVYL